MGSAQEFSLVIWEIIRRFRRYDQALLGRRSMEPSYTTAQIHRTNTCMQAVTYEDERRSIPYVMFSKHVQRKAIFYLPSL